MLVWNSRGLEGIQCQDSSGHRILWGMQFQKKGMCHSLRKAVALGCARCSDQTERGYVYHPATGFLHVFLNLALLLQKKDNESLHCWLHKKRFSQLRIINDTLQSISEPTATRYLILIYLTDLWEEKKYDQLYLWIGCQEQPKPICYNGIFLLSHSTLSFPDL